MKIYKSIYIIFTLIVLFIIVYLNIKINNQIDLSKSKPPAGTKEQLNFLDYKIDNGLAEEMQNYFPEGFIFTHVIYGLSNCEYARYNGISVSERKNRINKAEESLRKIESQKGLTPFKKNEDLIPTYGVFYQGWKNLLFASILRAKEKISLEEEKEFKDNCEYIYESFLKSDELFLPSYKYGIWPADNFTAIASLAIHDQIFEPKYSKFINYWLEKTKKEFLDSTNLYPHSINNDNTILEQSRGSSQALIIRLISEFNNELAKDYYKVFKENFKDDIIGFDFFREYKIGISGNGDIDSGPVILDIGPVATIVGMGVAKKLGDIEYYNRLRKSIEIFGLPLKYNNEKQYVFGQMPIADVFICWSDLALTVNEHTYENSFNVIFMIISILTFLIIIVLYLKYFYESKQKYE